eukprot:SAG31_NODE_15045_length_773_cov_1.354599_2_plen_205_part_00
MGQFLNEYDDIRYHTLKCVKVLLGSWLADPTAATATGLQRLVATLLTLSMPGTSVDALQSFWVEADDDPSAKRLKSSGGGRANKDSKARKRAAAPRSHRKAFGECWMELLRLPDLSPAIYRRILVKMHDQILPNISHPLLLSDFLTDAYNQGGSVAMLALHGLFVLMSKHGLEYPNFDPRCAHSRLCSACGLVISQTLETTNEH